MSPERNNPSGCISGARLSLGSDLGVNNAALHDRAYA